MNEKLIEKITQNNCLIGIGSGKTITSLFPHLSKNSVYVASSYTTNSNLFSYGHKICTLDNETSLDFYLDGADLYNANGDIIKGRGGCILKERYMMSISKKSYIYVQKKKYLHDFDEAIVPLVVLPFAVGYVLQHGGIIRKCDEFFEPLRTEQGGIMMEIPFKMLNAVKYISGVIGVGFIERDSFNYTIIELTDR